MKQSVESNYSEKYKVIASLPILQIFFKIKDDSENPVNLYMGI